MDFSAKGEDMREIKFRAWDEYNEKWLDGHLFSVGMFYGNVKRNGVAGTVQGIALMQYTGLKDKNGLTCLYDGDIIGANGLLEGNKYKNEDLLKDPTNLLIQGFGTSTWEATNKEAMERGCIYSE
jgi:hypothetical protein